MKIISKLFFILICFQISIALLLKEKFVDDSVSKRSLSLRSVDHKKKPKTSNSSPSDNEPNVTSFIIFKLARTGSTWFGSLLNSAQTMDKNKQYVRFIHEAHGCAWSEDSQIEYYCEYLHNQRNMFGGSVDNCIHHGFNVLKQKCCSASLVNDMEKDYIAMGLDVNPFHDPAILSIDSWKRILKPEKELFRHPKTIYVGVLTRSNLVKWTVSSVRAKKLVEMCHTKKIGPKQVDCLNSLDSKFEIDINAFKERLYRSFERHQELVSLANALSQHSVGIDALSVDYEALRINSTQAIADLVRPMGLPPLQLAETPFVKVNSEDLSQVLTNFDELEEALRDTCFHEQLLQSEPKQFELCAPPSDWQHASKNASSSHHTLLWLLAIVLGVGYLLRRQGLLPAFNDVFSSVPKKEAKSAVKV